MGTVVSFTNKGRIPLFLLGTGCHVAVSFPLPKCERCVKRGKLAPCVYGNPYVHGVFRGRWLA